MLLSNGLLYPKIRLNKFDFSSKTVPANIAKKLPLQRCFKPLLIPIFNFSHKRPTFAFTSESGYALGFRKKIAHNGLHAETRGSVLAADRLAAWNSQTASPFSCLNNFYFRILSNFLGSLQSNDIAFFLFVLFTFASPFDECFSKITYQSTLHFDQCLDRRFDWSSAPI